MVGNVTLDTAVLHKLAENGVCVLFLSGRRLHFKGILHGRLHSNGVLRVRQYALSLTDFALSFAKEVMLEKLSKMKQFLNEIAILKPVPTFS